jgi:M6 family metalloprotease-like protein
VARVGIPAPVRQAHVLSTPLAIQSLDEPWPNGVPIRLCAIRVEFLADQMTGTTGTGRIGSWFSDSTHVLHIDPLPHDKAYFEDHLAFLRHYYHTASKGDVSFAALDVYPIEADSAYVLPFPMWHYNYNIGEDSLNRRLVELFAQATELAAADVNYGNYDAVVIFHAGAGKDFGFGYDATPFDIPSAYINEGDLQSYPGPIPSGVSRGLILPEGENQQEALDLGVELSLNGIMVKLFGNWLGLPDLFDTRTGLSGIGRWGMMDQGSGNLGALVPALPDAWSRVFIGWETALADVPSHDGDTVRVARFGVSGAPEVVKLPITPSEYYLLENRDADADSTHHVTLYDRDSLHTMQVDEFGNIAIDQGFRSAVSASNYDFGIPGSGILIWHIDEDVIHSNIETNTVNANPDHRGVDLVEADASQDIGVEYGFASAGSGTELGIQDDAWYFGNQANAAANGGSIAVRFTDRTYPSARLYDGAYTYYELTNFSSVDSIMSFRLASSVVATGFPVALPAKADWGIADLDGDTVRELYLVSADSLYRADASGLSTLFAVPGGLRPTKLQPVDLDGDGKDELLFDGSQIGILKQQDSSDVLILSGDLTAAKRVYPARAADGTPLLLAVDEPSGQPNQITASLYTLQLSLIGTQVILQGAAVNPVPLNVESFPATTFVFIQPGEAKAVRVSSNGFEQPWQIQDARIGALGSVLVEPLRRSVYLNGYGYVDAASGDPVCLQPQCMAPGVDWDGDGIPDGGGLSGANNVPREDAPAIPADTEWVEDLDVNGTPDLIGLGGTDSSDSTNSVHTRVLAARHDGPDFTGFPMVLTIGDARRPFAWSVDNYLYVVAEVRANSQYVYSVTNIPVPARPGQRFRFQEDGAIINVGPLHPQVFARPNWLYCWPNPARDVSHIRVTLSYPAQASVKVFDLAGRKVAELQGSSSLAGPFEVLWDVSNVESGVYVGQVATNGGGTTQRAEVKIAVVR